MYYKYVVCIWSFKFVSIKNNVERIRFFKYKLFKSEHVNKYIKLPISPSIYKVYNNNLFRQKHESCEE